MKYRILGKTGYKVSEIGHGLWGAGGSSWFGASDDEIRLALQLSLDLGCNFFDSAYVYGTGKSDKLLGELIAKNPHKKIYAASKIPPLTMKWPASAKESYEESYPIDHVLEYAEVIRKSLCVQTIDLLQFHTWEDSWVENNEWKKTVKTLKERKLANAVGISINKWEAGNGIKAVKTGLLDSVQVVYNIFEQAPDDKLFEICKEMNVGVIARVPLDEGSLSGKLTLESKFDENDYRFKYFSKENLIPTLKRVDEIKKLVPDNMTLSQFSLRFILSNPIVSTTIVGMRNTSHVQENFSVSDGKNLDKDMLSELRNHRWDRTRGASIDWSTKNK